MAGHFSIFSIYKLRDTYYLLRTGQPGYDNASQAQQDSAEKIEQQKRERMLEILARNHNGSDKATFDFIGELQGYPIGDKLYGENGGFELDIYYLDTEFGKPWIILGNADSETEFMAELNNDEDLMGLKPIGEPKHISATFVTENDVDLSGIEHWDTKDVR